MFSRKRTGWFSKCTQKLRLSHRTNVLVYGLRFVAPPCPFPNIVEGCARRKEGEYLQFVNIATGSAAEALYLLELSNRLEFLKTDAYRRLEPRYTMLIKGLKKLQSSLIGEP